MTIAVDDTVHAVDHTLLTIEGEPIIPRTQGYHRDLFGQRRPIIQPGIRRRIQDRQGIL